MLRLTAAGALDASFGNAGSVTLSPPGIDANPFTSGMFEGLPDGRMVFAHLQPLTVLRLTAEGIADPTFNGTGSAAYALGVTGRAVAVNGDGSMFLGGANDGASSGVVMRVQPNGAIDAAWGDGGQRAFGENFMPMALAVQDDGRLVASGSAVSRAAFRRWNSDGTTDGSLRGGSGLAISYLTDAGNGFGTPRPLAIAPGGQALVGLDSSVGRFGGTLDVLGADRVFVEQQFRDFLSRPGDAGGIDYWTNQLSSGARTRAGLVHEFIGSPEFLARFAPIVRLYLAYFLRAPDQVGLLYWTDYYRIQGLDNASRQFALSAEFNARYGQLDNGQFVQLVYQNVLGRQPDSTGFAYWKSRLDSGEIQRWHMMTAFSEGAEYVGLSSNEVLVTMTYMGLLRRSPDAGGFSFWVSQLDAGTTAESFINGFLASGEYHNRFYP